jgi:hypothetical protein
MRMVADGKGRNQRGSTGPSPFKRAALAEVTLLDFMQSVLNHLT